MKHSEKARSAINVRSWRQRLHEYRKQPLSLLLKLLMILSAAVSAGVLLILIGYILVKGIPAIIKFFPSIFAWKYTSENVSMTPALVNTVIMTILSLAFAVPIGIFSAVYLVEYSKRGSWLVKLIRITTETLS